jgi:SAM-dependent methyltransferase
MNTQTFYNSMARYYHLIFKDWEKSIERHAAILDELLIRQGKTKKSAILDCACGIGTQALGLCKIGYQISGSDISSRAVARAKTEAAKRGLPIDFRVADFCALDRSYKNTFDIIIAMDNALPHLPRADLKNAIVSIYNQTHEKGILMASIRDYDEILKMKPSSSPPAVIPTEEGKRIVFQIWDWHGDEYDMTLYIIEDDSVKPRIKRFYGHYRAVTRAELTDVLLSAGYREIKWIFPEESGFYQPIVIALK